MHKVAWAFFLSQPYYLMLKLYRFIYKHDTSDAIKSIIKKRSKTTITETRLLKNSFSFRHPEFTTNDFIIRWKLSFVFIGAGTTT